MRWIKQLLFLMLIFVPGGPCVLSRDMAEGRLTLIQHPRAPYLVIFRAIWQSGSLRCGSRWGAAAPGSFWVSERTPSSVYWTLLLSWTVNKKKFVYPHWSMSAGLFLSQPSQRQSIPVLHLAGELLEDFGRAAVVLQLGLNQRCQLAHLLYLQHTHTHICCFHYHPCSVSMLGLSLAPHSMAQDGTLLKTVTMATREPC